MTPSQDEPIASTRKQALWLFLHLHAKHRAEARIVRLTRGVLGRMPAVRPLHAHARVIVRADLTTCAGTKITQPYRQQRHAVELNALGSNASNGRLIGTKGLGGRGSSDSVYMS